MSQDASMNPFASQVLIITIGDQNIPSNIHQALLSQKTSFFEIHPTPNGGVKEVRKGLERSAEPDVKQERQDSRDATVVHDTNGEMNGLTLNGQNGEKEQPVPKLIKSDYHLNVPHIKAFEVFVNWLYNNPPSLPNSVPQVKTLIQSYLIALKYEAFPLQDLIVDCLRRHFASNVFSFDILFIYLLNRHGDNPECKLIAYFVDQIAYEIYTDGYEVFAKQDRNTGIAHFLETRLQGKVRVALFKALAGMAHHARQGGRVVDPASSSSHDYYAAR